MRFLKKQQRSGKYKTLQKECRPYEKNFKHSVVLIVPHVIILVRIAGGG